MELLIALLIVPIRETEAIGLTSLYSNGLPAASDNLIGHIIKDLHTLTAEHLKEVFEAQNGICPITGWKLTLPTCRDSDYYTANPLLPNSLSLDRIDNSIGHINGNIRFVSVMANYARNRFNDEDLKGFIKAAYSHLGL